MSINGVNNTPPLSNYNNNQDVNGPSNQKRFDLSSGTIAYNSQEPDDPTHRSANVAANGGSGGTSNAPEDGGTTGGGSGPGGVPTREELQRDIDAGHRQAMDLFLLQQQESNFARQFQIAATIQSNKNDVIKTVAQLSKT